MLEKQYIIEKPPRYDFKPEDGLQFFFNESGDRKIISSVQENYLSWEEFRKKSWATQESQKIWTLVKISRQINSERSPIVDKEGRHFTFSPRNHVEFLHQVDLELGGNFMGIGDFAESDKRKFIRRNLIEESIASSQLEGANTSRTVAKKMLREGRAPKNKAEQMIVNNHETMRYIEEDLRKRELTIDALFELHRKITFKTIDEKHSGVLRETLDEKGNPLVIKPWDDETIAYTAPSKEFVKEQLPKLIDFANNKSKSGFIHPLIKAIMLHFWVGLLHPFEDGNGRLARILFYWYMLKEGYWAFSYLSLSERILKSPNQYSMAYIYSEQDDNDLNYFIHYNIDKLKLARENFEKYIKEKIKENKSKSVAIQKGLSFNQRQIDLLQHLAKDEQRYATIASYRNDNNIAPLTAIKDLKKLLESGYIKKTRNGRNTYYYPTDKIKEVFD